MDLLFSSRARVLADLQAREMASPLAVSALEEAMAARRWWAEQWPDGEAYVAGLVAQDVQDALVDAGHRWPSCVGCPPELPLHPLHITPELGGPDPHWRCEETGQTVARLGELAQAS
jgi:hypothetical protein